MTSSMPDPITQWIVRLQAGEAEAAQRVWEAYVGRLIAFARRRLADAPRRAADEQDAIQNAFLSFFRRAQAGQFSQLSNRHDLWLLLVTIAARKVQNLARDERRQKRGQGQVRGHSAFGFGEQDSEPRGPQAAPGPEPTPEMAVAVTEEFTRLMESLPDAELRRLALRKFEGYTNAEIAAELRCSERTIERRMGMIRKLWQAAADA